MSSGTDPPPDGNKAQEAEASSKDFPGAARTTHSRSLSESMKHVSITDVANELHAQVSEEKDALQQANQQIAELQAQVAEAKKRNSELETRIAESSQQNTELQAQNSSLAEKLNDLQVEQESLVSKYQIDLAEELKVQKDELAIQYENAFKQELFTQGDIYRGPIETLLHGVGLEVEPGAWPTFDQPPEDHNLQLSRFLESRFTDILREFEDEKTRTWNARGEWLFRYTRLLHLCLVSRELWDEHRELSEEAIAISDSYKDHSEKIISDLVATKESHLAYIKSLREDIDDYKGMVDTASDTIASLLVKLGRSEEEVARDAPDHEG